LETEVVKKKRKRKSFEAKYKKEQKNLGDVLRVKNLPWLELSKVFSETISLSVAK
jgi:hypothetical protein